MLRLAILLTVLVAAGTAYAMRPLPEDLVSKNVIDLRGGSPKAGINWRWPAKAPVSVTVKYGPPEQSWHYRAPLMPGQVSL